MARLKLFSRLGQVKGLVSKPGVTIPCRRKSGNDGPENTDPSAISKRYSLTFVGIDPFYLFRGPSATRGCSIRKSYYSYVTPSYGCARPICVLINRSSAILPHPAGS